MTRANHWILASELLDEEPLLLKALEGHLADVVERASISEFVEISKAKINPVRQGRDVLPSPMSSLTFVE